jgi:hypothetical protein
MMCTSETAHVSEEHIASIIRSKSKWSEKPAGSRWQPPVVPSASCWFFASLTLEPSRRRWYVGSFQTTRTWCHNPEEHILQVPDRTCIAYFSFAKTLSSTNLVLLMSYSGWENLKFYKKMQFTSWVGMLDLCANGHWNKSYSNQRRFIACNCKYNR